MLRIYFSVGLIAMEKGNQQKRKGVTAAFFNVGDLVMTGKFLNVPAKIIAFHDDGRGNPMVELQPLAKGKKTKTIALFKIRRTKMAARVALRYRVAARYIQAADDMEAILLKLRKGVTTPIETIGKLKKVLDHLGGWNVEPFVGVVHVLHVGKGYGSLEEMTALHAIAKQHEVKSLPVSPRVDEIYIMDLKEPKAPHPESARHVMHSEVWVGAKGFKITSPEGKTFEALPSKGVWDKGNLNGDIRKLPKFGPKPLNKFISSYAYGQWLRDETSFNQQVLDALGMGEHKKAPLRTDENTGSCPCCFRNAKLKWSGSSQKMVNHGFKRPGWGHIHGNCMGVGFAPFELSPAGTKHLVGVLEEQRSKLKEDPDPNSARQVEWITADIERLMKLIADWKEEPLPKAGVEVRDWQFKRR